MISPQQFRISIGVFNSKSQTALKYLIRHMKLGSTISSQGLKRILKPAPFCFVLSYMILALIIAGDVESNPGPVTKNCNCKLT